MATHYDLLGVRPDATAEEIQRAYRLLALRHHPDIAPGTDPATMAAINGAWAVLADPHQRRLYDASLRRVEVPLRPAPRGTASEEEPLDPDGEYDGEYDDDDLSDEPYVTAERRPSDVLVMTPVLLALAAVGIFFLSVLSSSAGLRTFSILLVPVSGIGFVMAPLFVMLRSKNRSGSRK